MARPLSCVATDFGTIAYTDTDPGAAPGPVALFVHGVFLNGYLWRHVIENVRDVRRCIAIDLMAHGETRTAPDQDVSFRAQAEMLECFREVLGIESIDLVGNDSGGGIAQIYAARHPERLSSLALTNCDVHDNWPPQALAPTRELIEQGGFAAFGRQMLDDIELARGAFSVGYEDPQFLTPQSRDIYLEPLLRSPEAISGIERWFGTAHDNRQTVEIESKLRVLKVPTLVVWGTADVFFPVEWAYWLKETIPGCRQVVELPGAKLFLPEERADDLAHALRGFWQTPATRETRQTPSRSD